MDINAVIVFYLKQVCFMILQGFQARQKIGKRAKPCFLLNRYVTDGFRHKTGSNGVDEIAVIGPGDIYALDMGVFKTGNGCFRMQGHRKSPPQVVDRAQRDEAKRYTAPSGKGQPVDGFVQCTVATHAENGIKSGKGGFTGPVSRISRTGRDAHFYIVIHRIQLVF